MIQLLVYRKEHDCNVSECTELAAYIRVSGIWKRIGTYGSECNRFDLFDLEKEKQDRLDKESHDFLKLQLRQIKQESRARLNTIKNDLNVNRSFFK